MQQLAEEEKDDAADVQALAEKLCDEAINVRRSKDNVSVLIIQLRYQHSMNKQAPR